MSACVLQRGAIFATEGAQANRCGDTRSCVHCPAVHNISLVVRPALRAGRARQQLCGTGTAWPTDPPPWLRWHAHPSAGMPTGHTQARPLPTASKAAPACWRSHFPVGDVLWNPDAQVKGGDDAAQTGVSGQAGGLRPQRRACSGTEGGLPSQCVQGRESCSLRCAWRPAHADRSVHISEAQWWCQM